MTDFNYEDRIKELELFNKWADFEGLDTKMSSETEHSSKETHLAFLAWIAAKAQAVPEKKIYLTCEQLYAAANFGAPNKDPELLETELTIAWFDEAHSGSGYYVYISEYPEEGAMKLESELGAEG
ncbi:TPA: hypothetical protein JI076_10490 [Acinetobacter baumannii]|nr:hypothetical protein IC763_06880 [Acinetobacter seifertii]HAV5331770.1 hypothetical protein [Acinetobacter baumannii]